MAFRHLTAGADIPTLDNRRKMETYCNKIISVLNNQQGYLQVFTKACEIIEQQLKEQGTSIDNRDTMTTVSFVDNFKKRLAQEFKR